MSEALKVADGQVVVMEYTLNVDGEMIDTSETVLHSLQT